MRKSTRMTVAARSNGRCEAVWWSDGQWEYRCSNPADDIHHALLRSRGGHLLDDLTSLHLFHLCRPCHDTVHANPARARRNRLIIDGFVTTELGRAIYRGTDPYLTEAYGPNPTRKSAI